MEHNSRSTLLDAFVVVSVAPAENPIEVLSPPTCRTTGEPTPHLPAKIGDAWLSGSRTLALKVPSAMVRGQRSCLIDPAHPNFAGIEVSDPEPLDPRIATL